MCDILRSTYEQEWDNLFHKKFYRENLRSTGIKGKLRNSHFRSICWKIFLECLPADPQSWIESIKLQRQQYDEILDKFQVNPRKTEGSMDISVNNPLSQSQQSPWNQYFQDSELKITIEQDVVRTFPEIEFFHNTKIQKMMISILFSYAREHPHISYKQGMHELLAPIIFVLHYDQEAYLEVSKTSNLNLDIRIMLNQNYIEHDAFFLFCQLMEAVEAWYTISDGNYSKCMNLVSVEPFTEDFSSINSLGLKLKNIYKCLLKHHDIELFSYLEQMEVTPQIFGIRWLRLLFGREFSIHDLLIVWDAIFADSIAFNLVDYIFVAMLIAIRDLLLKSDYTSCLQYLMHYPNITDVQYIIDLALHLRDRSVTKPELPVLQISNLAKEKHEILKDKPGFVKTSYSKSIFSSQSKHSVDKNQDIRPRTLKIPGVNSADSELAVGKAIQASENCNDVCCGAESIDNRTFDEPGVFSKNDDKETYNTFPRATIRNVMDGKNAKFRNLEVSQSFGLIEDKKILPTGALYREMVPFRPNSQNTSDNFSKKHRRGSLQEKIDEIAKLKHNISAKRMMNEYCAKQITQHITKLQECMIGQTLLFEDEMFIALAGLKRARDILKGTVAFTEEVVDDDHINNYTSPMKQSYSTVNTSPNKLNSEAELTKDTKISASNSSSEFPEHKVNENSEKLSQDFLNINSRVPITVAIEASNCLNSILPDIKRPNLQKTS